LKQLRKATLEVWFAPSAAGLCRQKAAYVFTKRLQEPTAVRVRVGDIRRQVVHESEMAGLLDNENIDLGLAGPGLL
jgi:hypothetical protein